MKIHGNLSYQVSGKTLSAWISERAVNSTCEQSQLYKIVKVLPLIWFTCSVNVLSLFPVGCETSKDANSQYDSANPEDAFILLTLAVRALVAPNYYTTKFKFS